MGIPKPWGPSPLPWDLGCLAGVPLSRHVLSCPCILEAELNESIRRILSIINPEKFMFSDNPRIATSQQDFDLYAHPKVSLRTQGRRQG